jgi:hypothetical protein
MKGTTREREEKSKPRVDERDTKFNQGTSTEADSG